MKKEFVILLISALASPLLAGTPSKGQKAISEAELKAHVEFLASAQLAGRDAPGPGSEIAQRYIATRFEEYGLQELSEAPGYYQTVPLSVRKVDYRCSQLIVKKIIAPIRVDSSIFKYRPMEHVETDTTKHLEPVKIDTLMKWTPENPEVMWFDSYPYRSQNAIISVVNIQEFTPNQDVFFFPRGGQDADIQGQVLLAGYGIRAPEFGYDDFADVDPAGKFLLVFNREPQENDPTSAFNGTKPTRYSNPIVKARLAKESGALGLLIVQPPNNGLPPIEETLHRELKRKDEPIVQLADDMDWFPVFYLKDHVAQAMLGEDFDLSAYQRDIDEQFRGDPRLLKDVTVTLQIRFKDVKDASTANIVGYWPGKMDEAVLVMAHHDHDGVKDGQIYYGADDNASGCAGLLGIARAFSAWGGSPKRSVIFLSTGAEEKGLLGAKYFVRHPPLPLEKIVAVINMDEIGRDGSSQFRALQDSTIEGEQDLLMVFYSGQTPQLADLAERANRSRELNLVLEPVLRFHGSSDHVPFHNRQIPSVFLFTGFHRDYSSPSDTPDKIVYPKLVQVAQFAFGLVYELAQRQERPVFDTSIREIEKTGRRYGY